MRRRDFITLLGGADAWPVAARAQQPERVRRVGLLMGIADSPVGQAYQRAFEQGLQRLGWTAGRNLEIEARWGEGRLDRFAEIVAEFVSLRVDVIVHDRNAIDPVGKAGNVRHPGRIHGGR